MKYLLLMTTAGSALYIGYWLWGKGFKSFLSHGMRYKALVFVVLVYVIPWAWMKGVYGYVGRLFLQARVPVINGHPVAIADIVTEREAYKTPDYRWQLLVVGVWTIVALGLMMRKAITYFRNKRRLLSVARECDDCELEETVERLRKELRYKGRFEVVSTPGMNTTFTLGAVRPVVFLQDEYSEGQLYYILKHEMTHVVRKDLLLKLLLELACCLHWFNPLVYILKNQFDDVCEASCDERVLLGCTKDEGKAYSRLLVDNLNRLEALGAPRKRIPFGSGLGDAFDKTKERVNLIMNAKVIKSWKKRVASGVFAVLVAANSLTALAYPSVYHVEDNKANVVKGTVAGDAFWEEECAESDYMGPTTDIIYDNEFIDAEGNITPVESFSPYVFCFKHDIVSGYYRTHLKDDKGGCTVEVYESTKCLNCNTIWIGDLYSRTYYVKCPH